VTLGLVSSSDIDHILLVSSTNTIILYLMTQKKKNQVVMPIEVATVEDEDETERYQTSNENSFRRECGEGHFRGQLATMRA
jgi:hypothetical protein